jgi:predicted protein tyrosine phosphatase
MDVFLVAAAAFDDADVAALGEMLDVGQRRAVEFDQLIRAISRSSMSRIAMWQPKHPASEAVAIRALRSTQLIALRLDIVADQALVEFPLADRRGEADALADDAADRADLGRDRDIVDLASVWARSAPFTATRR